MVIKMTSQTIKSSRVNTAGLHQDQLDTARLIAETILFITKQFSKQFSILYRPSIQKSKHTPSVQKKSTRLKRTKTFSFHASLDRSSNPLHKTVQSLFFQTKSPFSQKEKIFFPKTLEIIDTKRVEKIPPRQFKEMPLEQLQKLTEQSTEKLTARQILTLLIWRSWTLSKDLILKIPPKDIQRIPHHCIHNLSPNILKMMDAQQFKNITPEQIQVMRPVQMLAMTPEHIEILSQPQIKALKPSHIAALSNQQLFSFITSGKLGLLSEKQLSHIPRQTKGKIDQIKQQLFPKKGAVRRKIPMNLSL